MEELTEFQKDIINVLVGDTMYGLGVKSELEEFYGEEINHGRLYPNLDRLEEAGLVVKHARDERTNEYELTDEGRERIRREIGWRLEQYVGGSERRGDEVREALEAAEKREDTAEAQ